MENCIYYFSTEDKKIEEVLTRYYTEVTTRYPKNRFVLLGLYGSQNYGLDTFESDVDVKTIIVPTKRDLILDKKKVSTEIFTNEGMNLVQDIRLMCSSFFKGNINFLEILFTDYRIYNKKYESAIFKLFQNKDIIANRDPMNLFRVCKGMILNKNKLFDKPIESKMGLIRKYGYDPKQLVHMVRLKNFLERYLTISNFQYALRPSPNFQYALRPSKEFCFLGRSFKTNPLKYDDANRMRKGVIKDLVILEKYYLEFFNNEKWNEITREYTEKTREILDNFIYECIDIKLKEDD